MSESPASAQHPVAAQNSRPTGPSPRAGGAFACLRAAALRDRRRAARLPPAAAAGAAGAAGAGAQQERTRKPSASSATACR